MVIQKEVKNIYLEFNNNQTVKNVFKSLDCFVDVFNDSKTLTCYIENYLNDYIKNDNKKVYGTFEKTMLHINILNEVLKFAHKYIIYKQRKVLKHIYKNYSLKYL